MNLFESGLFTLSSGKKSAWKIECDALTDVDIKTIALIFSEMLPPFCFTEPVMPGGERLAMALERYTSPNGVALIVDDVLTTGRSMESQRAGRPLSLVRGAVIFSRADKCAEWITPLFTMKHLKQEIAQ